MPLPFVVGCGKFRMSGQIGAGEWGMIFHFDTGGTVDVSDVDYATFATDIKNAWVSHIAPVTPTGVNLTAVVVEGLNSATDGVGAWAGSQGGTSMDNPTMASVCVLEKDVISRRYRGGHPRHYWPTPGLGQLLSTTQLSSSGVSAWQGAIDAFHVAWLTSLASIVPGTVSYVNVSYYTGHALRPTPVVDTILGYSIESMVATQRRRIGR